uniref:Uncharacterized protein n=1 Tax=Rhizophora mucronata TaxID=61149 RepID=A0A2P2INA1_RHIMU
MAVHFGNLSILQTLKKKKKIASQYTE